MTTTSAFQLDASKDPIKLVTVFKSNKAEIIREIKLDLKQGENKVEITNLSSAIDTQSARVSGLGGAARLSDVVCTVARRSRVLQEQQYAPIRPLEKRKKALVSQKDILVNQANLLNNYGESLTGEHVGIDRITGFLAVYVEHKEKTAKAVEDIEEQIEDLEKTIELEKEKVSKGRTNGKVSITLFADEDAPTTLRLTYIVSDAGWAPIYDLHASTQEPESVTLFYRARITQSTGEDWKDTALTLSTTAAQTNNIPNLLTYRIYPKAPPSTGRTKQTARKSTGGMAPRKQLATKAARKSVAMLDMEVDEDEDEEEEDYEYASLSESLSSPLQALTESSTTIRTSSLASIFTVQGLSTIPSDGVTHTVSIASGLKFDSQVTRVAVPRLGAEVYLQCKVKNGSDYRLLPGSVSIFLDEGYASKTVIPETGPNDTFICPLGVDPSILLTYERTSKAVNEPTRIFGDTSKVTTTFTCRTTVHNKSSAAISGMVFRDALPLVNNEKDFNVLLKRPAGLLEVSGDGEADVDGVEAEGRPKKRQRTGDASSKKVRWSEVVNGKGGEKDGKYEWVVSLGAEEEVSLEMEYEVKAPQNLEWYESASA